MGGQLQVSVRPKEKKGIPVWEEIVDQREEWDDVETGG